MAPTRFAPSHYDVLQLRSDACADEIRTAWRRLVRRHHPDHGAAASGELMQDINRAYEVLSRPHTRAQYDLDLRLRTGGGRARRRWTPGSHAWLLAGLAGLTLGGTAGALLHRSYTPAPPTAVGHVTEVEEAPLSLVPARKLESWRPAADAHAAARP